MTLRAKSKTRGFTLIELMVVTLIIVILLAITFPSLSRIRLSAMRRACMQNVRDIVYGCAVYAGDITMSRGGPRSRLPTVGPVTTNWADIEDGNPACMWLLVKFRFVAREKFFCPEAGLRMGYYKPAPDDESFKFDTDTKISSLSYSYISMVDHPDDDEQDWGQQTFLGSGDIDSRMVIVADKNGHFGFNATTADKWPNNKHNSRNHNGEGQNIAHMDQSVEWLMPSWNNLADATHTEVLRPWSNAKFNKDGAQDHHLDNSLPPGKDTKLSRWDDIYRPASGNLHAGNGLRTRLNDAFLIP